MNLFQNVKKIIQQFNDLDLGKGSYLWVGLYVCIMVITFINNWIIGLLMLALLIGGLIYLTTNMKRFTKSINSLANQLLQSIRESQNDLLSKSPYAVLLYNQNKRVRWLNPAMQNIFRQKNMLGEPIKQISESMDKLIEEGAANQWLPIELNGEHYKLMHNPTVQSIYLMDVSQEVKMQEQRQYDRIVFGYLYLDDYNEVIESMDDEQAANFDAQLLKELNSWFGLNGIYAKRIDDERFILLFNKRVLSLLEEDQFSFFEELQEKNYQRNIPISISLGIAYAESDDKDYAVSELANQAQLNIDLAQGRGGDQVVVRAPDQQARFYGGTMSPTQKRTNIRSKLVFQALETSVEQADLVLIAGHKIPDMDSMGSSLGLYKLILNLKKPVRILVNPSQFNSDVKELLLDPGIQQNWSKIFIEAEEVKGYLTDRSLIIMVDHHRPSISEAESFIEGHDVVIIDHHRRGEDFPKNLVLTYIEPYASSASELVTEFYMNLHDTDESLSRFEATALLAGIIVDTNNFAMRTGSRTFDAASYLKSRGADLTQIHRLLKEDQVSMILRNNLVAQGQFVTENCIVSCGTNDQIYNNIVVAQAADMLLDIKEVEASFVIYRRNEHEVGISARSLGEINVQLIMEQLGGGGHLSNAATQLKDVSTTEAFDQLILIIQENEEE